MSDINHEFVPVPDFLSIFFFLNVRFEKVGFWFAIVVIWMTRVVLTTLDNEASHSEYKHVLVQKAIKCSTMARNQHLI